MSNFNCANNGINNTIGAANQLKFITWCRDNGMQNGQTGALAPVNPSVNITNTPPPQYQRTINQDIASFSTDKYSADDGKISAKEKLVNFGKGVISPVTMMFSSPKNFAIGAAGIIGGGLLIAATGGAAAPVMVAAGVTGGAIGLIKSGYNALTAKTDDEARQAWQGLGLGTTAVAGSVAGSKAALKGAGIDTKNLNVLNATVECFKNVPAQVGKTVSIFKSGEAILNIKNVLHIKNKDTKTAGAPDDKSVNPDLKQKTDTAGTSEAQITDADNLPLSGDDTLSAADMPEGDVAAVKPKKVSKPRRKRHSRIKHEVSKEQAQQVRKEVKGITEILDDFAADNNIDTQFRSRIEDVRRIAANPMEDPKGDTESLISAIKHLESCRDNPETITVNGKNTDFPFDDAISYIEKLLSGEYKIDRLQAKAGDMFDAKTMSALEVEHTNDSKLNNTVFKMLFSGFKKQEKKVPPSGWKIKVVKYTTEN